MDIDDGHWTDWSKDNSSLPWYIDLDLTTASAHNDFDLDDQQSELLGFANGARVFDFAAYSFDIAVHNVFATLTSGGCLCVPAEKDRWGNISQAVADTRATIIDLTPLCYGAHHHQSLRCLVNHNEALSRSVQSIYTIHLIISSS